MLRPANSISQANFVVDMVRAPNLSSSPHQRRSPRGPARVHLGREGGDGSVEVGKSYATRSSADYDCIFSFVILARTDKTVTVDVHGKTVQRRINVYGGVEKFNPFGTYSLCPVIYADDYCRQLAANTTEAA